MNESKNISPPKEKKIVRELQPKNGENKKELVVLRGITTSQINQALKAKSPYPARVFLKVERSPDPFNKGLDNQEQHIPTFFRIKDKESWIKPKIKTGPLIEVQGYFNNPKNGSFRKSFTVYSYQILENHE